MNVFLNSFMWCVLLTTFQNPNSIESLSKQSQAWSTLQNWLKQTADILGNVSKVGTLLFVLGAVLVGIVLYFFITNRKTIKKLDVQTKQELKEMLTTYRLDTQLQDDNPESPICKSILPIIMTSENQSVDPAKDIDLCNFAMERKITYLIGDGGLGKTSLLLHIADNFCKKKIKTRQKVIMDGSSNVLVQILTSNQLNETSFPSSPQEKSYLLKIICERMAAKSNSKSCIVQKIIETPKIIQIIERLLKHRSKQLFCPEETWASFENKRKRKPSRNKSDYDFRLLLLIDGYNDLTNCARDKVDKDLNRLNCDTNGSVSVIVTSRYKPGQWPESICKLKELSKDQIEKYINSTIGSSSRTQNGQSRSSNDMVTLLDRPILLTMYCKTHKLANTHSISNLPFHNITSVSDIYWNYLCCHLFRSFGHMDFQNVPKDTLTKKAVMLFYVLPCIAMTQEANCKDLTFSTNDLEVAAKHVFDNKNVLLQGCNLQFSIIRQNLCAESSFDMKFALDFIGQELPMVRIRPNSVGNCYYEFTHEFYRNFLAAVYKVQRDIATLNEVNDNDNRYYPYTYLDCEKLPDISLMIRKFYYELAAYYFRFVSNEDERNKLASNSVRYNSLLSDMYYYGDAFNDVYNESLKFEENMEKALNCAEKAISIGTKRIESIDPDNPEEMNKKTDMTILCWARWNATHIIQFDMKKFCSDEETLKEYRIKAYQYSKDNARATNYGDFIGYDKLAQMLYENVFLPENIIDEEITAIPEKDEKGVFRTRDERIRLLCEEYLKYGQDKGYHFSFNKPANWLERDLIKSDDWDNDDFTEQINTIYSLLCKSYNCKNNDYYALSRIIFYGICYNDKIHPDNIQPIPELIATANSSMSKQLSFHGTNEIYGYDNFCENAGFWYLMKMLSREATPNLNDIMDLVEILDKNQEKNLQIDKDAAIQAADYYKKLFVSTHNKLGSTFDNANEKNTGLVKTRLKAAIAHQFVNYIYNHADGIHDKSLIEDLCDISDLNTIVNTQFIEFFLEKENKFFMEERYTVFYKFLQKEERGLIECLSTN